MRHGEITKKWENDEGKEVIVTFPAKNEVCPECDGEGFVLAGGLRGEAFSAEEFCESFDPDEREEYFRPGGIYDERCDVCHGKNVVPVVDEEQLTEEQKKLLADYEKWQEEQDKFEADYRAEREAERRMGC